MPKTLAEVQQIAQKHQWQLNSNQKIVMGLIAAENRNEQKYGSPYCPCKTKHAPENVCPCENAQIEIDADGHCHCQMFFAL